MATNGVYIVMGEANTVVALLNKARRQYQLSHQPPSLEDTDPLLRNFTDLKEVLIEVADLIDMNPLTYLSPFLDVIKAQNTNGPITESALSAVAKFLSYGLIDASSIKAANAVESIAYAVVHTKFIGGKSSGSDECVLFKILQVLRSLLLSPPGSLLSNEAVCDMMQSCFRIVFEQNLSLLLRKAAEATLADMTQLIFTRLPTFVEDTRHPYLRKLVKNGQSGKRQKRRRKKHDSHKEKPVVEPGQPSSNEILQNQNVESAPKHLHQQGSVERYDVVLTTDPAVDVVTDRDPLLEESTAEAATTDVVASTTATTTSAVAEERSASASTAASRQDAPRRGDEADSESENTDSKTTVVISRHAGLQRDVVSDDDDDEPMVGTNTTQMPYGLPCCRELLRFLIAMSNPLDRQNTESMVLLGLSLLTVALEAAADHLSSFTVLMPLIKDDFCRSLLQLLDTEKLPVLAATNRCCFLLFESMRANLKFQLEAYLRKLQSIVLSVQKPDGGEQKEMALESLVQLWRIPGLVTELYLNYDCDLYCTNIFEDMTKLLVENSFPTLGGHTASLLSLDALLVVIDTIDQNCVFRQTGGGGGGRARESAAEKAKTLELPILSGYDIGKKITTKGAETSDEDRDSMEKSTIARTELRSNRHIPTSNIPSMAEVIDQKKRKRIIAEGTELFNQNPKKGIEFLREKGLLGVDATSVVNWLRANPQLDKNRIADYICSRKNAEVLQAFVGSFPFENTRLDVALRMFLETFRLPGEAAEISMVMQHFSDEWYRANRQPFNHVDAAFTLSYAIIMLNMDQHNPQVRRNQPPMTVDCFKRNLSGTNGGQDFDPDMLVPMYNAIKSDEIVMPAEQTGLVKENYLWKVLLRRGETPEGDYYHAPSGWNDHDLFAVCWGPAVAALSYVFDKSDQEQILQKALNGYRKCASIAAHYGMKEVFDNLVIHLCKFSTLTSRHDAGEENLEMQRQRGLNERAYHSLPEDSALAFGENHKAQLATRTLFELAHSNGDILREGWRNLLEVLLQLFKAWLLPADLTEVEDFVDEKGWVSIQRQHAKDNLPPKNDSGLLSWFGLGGSASEVDRKNPTQEQLGAMKLASTVIAECRPSLIVADSKYLTSTSLSELLNALSANSMLIVEHAEPRQTSASLSGEDEDAMVFYLELMVAISIENKDRLPIVWPPMRRHLEWLLSPRFGRCPVLVERAVVGLLRVANRNLFRDNIVADDVLQSLSLLLRLSPKALFVFSRQIAYGLYELIRANAANVHKKEHWAVLFSLLEAAGAAVLPDDVSQSMDRLTVDRNAFSDGEHQKSSKDHSVDDRGYTSDEPQAKGHGGKLGESRADSAVSLDSGTSNAARTATTASADWIHLDHRDAAKATEEALRALGSTAAQRAAAFSRGTLLLRTNLGRHEPAAFLKVCECLAFLLRDAVHVTPDNFESSLQCLRTMVEASLDGGGYAAGPLSGEAQNRLRSKVTNVADRTKVKHHHHGKKDMSMDVVEDEGKKEEQQLSANYQQMSLHLLDLCSQLHSQAPAIFAKWAESGADQKLTSVAFVWSEIWRPLLQAMARLSCDCRRLVRSSALTHVQRAFLPSNMANLGAAEWESCFGEVLFPLLSKLLEPFSPMDPIGMEETRMRAIQIAAKTLLNHLGSLSQLASFSSLWLRLLDYMEQYLKIDSCGNLNETVPELLKNMLHVLNNTETFARIAGLYEMTVERLNNFLPQLIRDTIPNPPKPLAAASTSPPMPTTTSSSTTSLNMFGRVQIAPAIPNANLNPNSTSTTSDADGSNAANYSSNSELHQQQTSSAEPPTLTTLPEGSDVLHGASTAGHEERTAPVYIPELTEVIVHSGATSPIASSPSESWRNALAAAQHQPQQQAVQPEQPLASDVQGSASRFHLPTSQYDLVMHQHHHQHHQHQLQQQQQQQQQHQQVAQGYADPAYGYNQAAYPMTQTPQQPQQQHVYNANPYYDYQLQQQQQHYQQYQQQQQQQQQPQYPSTEFMPPYGLTSAENLISPVATPAQGLGFGITPTIHGQYARSNPLVANEQTSQTVVTPSANSAFSQVVSQQSTPTRRPNPNEPQESPYFAPIPYPPPPPQ